MCLIGGRHLNASIAVLSVLGTASALPGGSPAPEPGATPPAVPALLTNSPAIRGLERAQRRPDGALVVPGQLSGTGSVKAKHVIIEGELSPGHSPGCIDFAGDVTFTAMATLLIEIGGSIACTGYDKVSVAGTLTLNGATVEVALVNGFVPQYGDQFDVLDRGSLTGSFGSIDTTAATLPTPLLWDTSQLDLTGELRVDVQHLADGGSRPLG
jgi:hypothetical protein